MSSMSIMHAMHLAGIDLNLLVALDAMLVERSVTRAAKRVGLTQPAMSHALARLRELFADPILVRTKTGMEPTTRARAIAPTLAAALSSIERAIAEPPKFEPMTATRTFTIATSDYMELVLLPPFIERLTRAAPHVNLQIRDVPVGLDALADGSLDLIIRPLPSDMKRGFLQEKVFKERFVCVLRKGHPIAKKKLTLDRYCEAKHVLISPHGPRVGFVDDLLARMGRTRNIALVLQHFLVAPHIVGESDLIITLGERLARRFQKILPLEIREIPFDVPGFTIAQIWHERQEHDSALAWLRREVQDVARTRAVT